MKVSKKSIREAIEEGFNQALLRFDLTAPSKKTQKLLGEASKKISDQIRNDLKKDQKKKAKLAKTPKKRIRRNEE